MLEEMIHVKRDQRQWDTDSNDMFHLRITDGSSEYLAIIGRIFRGWYCILVSNGTIDSDRESVKNENVSRCSIEIRRNHWRQIYFAEVDHCRSAETAYVHLVVSHGR